MAGRGISGHLCNISDLFPGAAEQLNGFVHAEVNQVIIKIYAGLLFEKIAQICGIYVEAAAEFLD